MKRLPRPPNQAIAKIVEAKIEALNFQSGQRHRRPF